MNRYAVLIGSAVALLAALAFSPATARADGRLTVYLSGQPIVLTHVQSQGPARAIAADDPGLAKLLDRIGATLTWQPGERYVLFTTGEPVVVSFAIGDPRYDVGPIRQTGPFAPYLLDGHPYVPLDQLIHALDFAVKSDGTHLVLQPQLASIGLQSTAGGAKLVAHAGIPIDARVKSESPNKLVVTFEGVGSMLPPTRVLGSGPVRRIDAKTTGTVDRPQTRVTLYLAPGTTHSAPGTDDQRDFTIGFNGAPAGQAIAQAPAAVAQPEPQEQEPQVPVSPAPQTGQTPDQPSASPAAPVQVTGVQTSPENGSFIVRISLSGAASYDWHRLLPPDNRFWLDVHGAQLAIPPENVPGSDPVTAVRVHQDNPAMVRIALSLNDFDQLSVVPDSTGITITVNSVLADLQSVPHGGSGTTGNQAVAQSSPLMQGPWKFAPRPTVAPYAAANPRLIVIDPGHGGSDAGSVHGGMVEKIVTLQISKRLRDILVARGWQVIMTRNTDRDVYPGPGDPAVPELQARDNVANANGARIFVSIHLNAYINAGPHGSTVYYYKPMDLPLAQAIDKRIGSEVDISNDGIVKDKLYVVHHADMPATLIEAAFDSNPDDRAKLRDPQWQEQLATAIADGIQDYAGPPPPPDSASGE